MKRHTEFDEEKDHKTCIQNKKSIQDIIQNKFGIVLNFHHHKILSYRYNLQKIEICLIKKDKIDK